MAVPHLRPQINLSTDLKVHNDANNTHAHALDLPHAASTDTAALVTFALTMASKLYQASQKGRSGWDDPAQCSVESLQRLLQEHVFKGDPVDVAIYAMFLHARNAGMAYPDAFNVIFTDNMLMRDVLQTVLDEVSPGTTPISVDSSLPRSLIDQVARAASGNA